MRGKQITLFGGNFTQPSNDESRAFNFVLGPQSRGVVQRDKELHIGTRRGSEAKTVRRTEKREAPGDPKFEGGRTNKKKHTPRPEQLHTPEYTRERASEGEGARKSARQRENEYKYEYKNSDQTLQCLTRSIKPC